MIYTQFFEAYIDYCMWFYLQNKFSGPARMIARGAEMEEFMKQFSLNGIRNPNICKPE
jgi:hypothetical protein